MTNRNCLSYWFPRLEASRVLVPRTIVIRWPFDLTPLLDGKQPEKFDSLCDMLLEAADALGWPAFLRTGQGSGKHHWKNTCYLTQHGTSIEKHVGQLVEWSHTVDFFGLPHDVWCVREMLPVKPICTLPAYGGFPLVREARCFIAGGKVVCKHPYWPEGALREGFPIKADSDADGLTEAFEHEVSANFADLVQQAHGLPWDAITPVVAKVAEAFAGDGAWSVDLLETDRGWIVTDMAEAARSFHWPGCEFAKGLQ
jgi:hypothetical protein